MELEVKEKQMKRVKKKAVIPQSECVACGTCVKVCPREAITIIHGIYAKVNEDICIGCGKCKIACPASIIRLEARV
jgi:NAD-dependent dihydropyrimidine dehydrogenase PreA subunit